MQSLCNHFAVNSLDHKVQFEAPMIWAVGTRAMSSQSPKGKGKQREPPPSLFLGPPSHNASQVSLPGILIPGNNLVSGANTITSPSSATAQRAPLLRQRSQRVNPRSNLDGPADAAAGASLSRAALPLPRQQQASEGQKQADRIDALWAEMQSTLEDVDISAVNGTHIFRQKHNKALEDLRTAQIALAQAWARSEADTAVETADKENKALRGSGMLGSESNKSALGGTDGAKSTVDSVGGRPGSSSGADKTGMKPEEETEADILLARKRREANDKYFDKVNSSVLDVVAQLEEVAKAMRAVEQESRDIWGESESAMASIS